MTDPSENEAPEEGGNPYEAPANAAAPRTEEPSVALWVTGCSLLGATLMGFAELRGATPALTHWPAGLGGLLTGGLAGAIVGRVIGRLLMARHRFRQLAQRVEERKAEFEENRPRGPS